MAHPPAAPCPVRPYGTPDKFSGSRNSDFVAWEQHFDQVSQVSQWTVQDQAAYCYSPLYLTENTQSYFEVSSEHYVSHTGQYGQYPTTARRSDVWQGLPTQCCIQRYRTCWVKTNLWMVSIAENGAWKYLMPRLPTWMRRCNPL